MARSMVTQPWRTGHSGSTGRTPTRSELVAARGTVECLASSKAWARSRTWRGSPNMSMVVGESWTLGRLGHMNPWSNREMGLVCSVQVHTFARGTVGDGSARGRALYETVAQSNCMRLCEGEESSLSDPLGFVCGRCLSESWTDWDSDIVSRGSNVLEAKVLDRLRLRSRFR